MLRRWLARRHPLPVELVLVTVLYFAYDTARGAALSGAAAAVAHARDVYRLERALGMAAEPAVQHASQRIPGLTVAFGITYMLFHLLATGAVLLWLHRSRHRAFVRMRLALLAASVLSLAGFVLWPTAPPRLAGIGMAGTLSQAGVAMSSPTLTLLYNPYAAFPSLHVAYATLTGYALWRWSPRRVLRAGGIALPVWVAIEVVATGNHFVLDVLAGAGVAALGLFAADRLVRSAQTGEQVVLRDRRPGPVGDAHEPLPPEHPPVHLRPEAEEPHVVGLAGVGPQRLELGPRPRPDVD